MAGKTKIQWTESTLNPIRAFNLKTGRLGWHCEHASPGCINCYAEGMNKRVMGTGLPYKPGHLKDVEIFLDREMLEKPLRWQRPRMIFLCSMTDLFADFVPDAMIDQVFAMMALTPQHTYQCLTKRSARMRAYITDPSTLGRIAAAAQAINGKNDNLVIHPPTNAWLGVSVEDQVRAHERIPDLLATPAAVRWISAEPLIGPVNLDSVFDSTTEHVINPLAGITYHSPHDTEGVPGNKIDWIVVGGESGPDARPMRRTWADDIVRQCRKAGTKVFVKQLGSAYVDALSNTYGANRLNGAKDAQVDRNRTAMLRITRLKDRKGGDIAEFPDSLKVREWPR